MDTILKRRKPHVPSADIQASMEALVDVDLQDRRVKISEEIHGFDSKMDSLDSEIERLNSENTDLLLRKAVGAISKEDFEDASEKNRDALAKKNQEREDCLKSVELLNVAQNIVLREMQKRKFSRTMFENAALQNYSKPLFEAAQQRAAEAVRELVVLAGWKHRLPIVGDVCVDPDTVVRDALNKVFSDHTFYARQHLVDYEKQLRKEVIAQIEGKATVENQQ